MTTDSGTLTLNGTASVTDSIVLDSATGDLTVTGALLATTNGTHDVTINSGGTAKIGGAVGNATAASDLFFANLTTDAGGTTEFNEIFLHRNKCSMTILCSIKGSVPISPQVESTRPLTET